MILFSIYIFISSFFIKWILIRNATIDFDTYGHLYYVKELRLQGRSPWKKIYAQSWDGRYLSHPFFLHSILSYIKSGFLLKYQKFINVFLDSLFSIFIFITAKYIFKDLNSAFFSVLIYWFTPIWFSKISMGPRIGNFTPRLFTELIFNILIVVLFGIYNLNYITFFTLAVFLTSLILLTSKFGLQVILFVLPLTILFTNNLSPILVILFSFLLLIIISKGSVFNLFREQLKHLKNYYVSNSKRNTSISNRNDFVRFPLKSLLTFSGIRKFIYTYLFYNSYTIILFKMPILIILFFFFFKYFSILSDFYFKSNLFITSVFLLFLIISSKRFLFLGEAERYLNHIAIIIIFNFVYFTNILNATWAIYFILFYGIIYYILEVVFYDKFIFNENKEVVDKKIELFLKSMLEKRVVLCYPYHNFNVWRLMLNTHHYPIVPTLMNSSKQNLFLAKYDVKSTFLDLDRLEEILKLTDCSLIIVYTPALLSQHLNYEENLINADWFKVDLQDESYRVYIKN